MSGKYSVNEVYVKLLSRKHMLVSFASLIKFIMFIFVMLRTKMVHDEYCTEPFPNAFYVIPISKKILLSNTLNLRLTS